MNKPIIEQPEEKALNVKVIWSKPIIFTLMLLMLMAFALGVWIAQLNTDRINYKLFEENCVFKGGEVVLDGCLYGNNVPPLQQGDIVAQETPSALEGEEVSNIPKERCTKGERHDLLQPSGLWVNDHYSCWTLEVPIEEYCELNPKHCSNLNQ